MAFIAGIARTNMNEFAGAFADAVNYYSADSAKGMPAGVRRDGLPEKAGRAEAAVHMNRWFAPSSVQP